MRASCRHGFSEHPLVAGLAVALGLGAAVAMLLRDPRPHILARRSQISSAIADAPFVDGAFVVQLVRLRATSGLAVDLTVKRAIADSDRTLPLVVLLGGHHTGRDAARLVGPTPGVVAAALSYPFPGDPRPDAATFMRDIPRIRQAFLDTPAAVMLSLDYLLRLPQIDTTDVEAVGVSLGAPFMVIAGSLDRRFTRVWSIHGSGGSYAPLEANMRRTVRPALLRWIAAGIANVIISGPRLAPEQWVGHIAPRPFIMVNTADDERLPREGIESLYAAAREPKELIWTTGMHVHADSAAVAPLVKIVLDRVTTGR